MDLMDADLADQVRFQLPVCVGKRYGSLPEGMASAPNVTERISITVDVRMKGEIKSMTSPTHDFGPSKASVEYRSGSFLHQDFVLIVKADGLDEPRCFAERHPTGTVAMQLNMVPKFDAPPVRSQEYIFLVDRSGSMDGDRIETAKNALLMLLRVLPAEGTKFNIFSFGWLCDSLFPESVTYDESTLEKAVRDTHMRFVSLVCSLCGHRQLT